jgi:tetratricopeptide (TPR) repeat protein
MTVDFKIRGLIMKPVFLLRGLCICLIVGSLLPAGLLQARIDYNQYMQLGYTATRQRNYAEALDYFKQALYERPGDRYATIAVRNLERYILRDRRAGGKRKRYVTFIPNNLIPTNLGVATKRTPGATRNVNLLSEGGEVCLPGKQRLTALIPEVDVQRTTTANPTFFFYVPQTSAPVMELVLQNDQEQVIYQKTWAVPSKPGIINLTLPTDANAPGLKFGKSYKWYFSLICDRNERSSDYVINGAIERIAPPQKLKTQLEKAKPEEQAAIYALSGFWEDSLTLLAQLRQTRPNDLSIKNDWEDLLRSEGLEEIVKEPFLGCCN